MPKQKPENKLSEKEQWERFKKAAEEKGVDPSDCHLCEGAGGFDRDGYPAGDDDNDLQ